MAYRRCISSVSIYSVTRTSLYHGTNSKAVYERHCQSFHGLSGRGDGPVAASLKVPPVNFQRFQSFLKSDEKLLRIIEHGIVFSPMHSWRGRLTDGEMQDVMAYIRLLSQ